MPRLRRTACSFLLLLACTLALAPTWSVAQPPSPSPFRPSLHGFHFRNSFRGSPVPAQLGALGDLVSRSLKLPTRFGLCGGMCFAAADNYFAGRSPPPDTTPPAEGTDLYTLIYTRQVDSFGPSFLYAAKFAQWMALDDDGREGTRARTLLELPALLDRLKQGELVHLGLVHVSFRETHELWHNHQVLAYGVTHPDPPTPGAVDILVYDPNYPGRDDIRVRLSVVRVEPLCVPRLGLAFHAPPALGVRGSLIATDGTPLKNVRGLFMMPYERREPPAPSR